MLTLPRSVRIFVALGPVDMRCGFDKLGAMVAEMGMDVYSGHLFAFASKRGDRIKILAWDHGGFVLWYKRLERGRFKLPEQAENEATVALDRPSLAMLLDGADYPCAAAQTLATKSARQRTTFRSGCDPTDSGTDRVHR